MSRRAAAALALMIGVPGATLLSTQQAGFRINTSSSMPCGIWHIEPIPAQITRGMIVTACLPPGPIARMALQRGYVGLGDCPGGAEPLLKPIAAIPGDVVQVTADGISVNGTPIPNAAPLSRDGDGRSLPAMPRGEYVVPPGSVWLLSSYSRDSFDGRYFGRIPMASIQSAARPVLVFP